MALAERAAVEFDASGAQVVLLYRAALSGPVQRLCL